MKRSSAAVLDDLLKRYPALASCDADIRAAGEMLIGAFRSGGKLLVCGNGGSCADGQHLVGELMKAFILPRKLNAEESGLLTALDPEYGGYMAEKLQGRTWSMPSRYGDTAGRATCCWRFPPPAARRMWCLPARRRVPGG